MAAPADTDKTVKVRYVGPLAAVEIQDDEQLVTIAHGDTYDVSAADAKWMCAQEDNWHLVGADAKRRKGGKDDTPVDGAPVPDEDDGA